MANEIRKITLTQYNGESGPAYNVEYSTDCITYSQSLDCTNLFLPSVGSFGLCTVDEDTTCIRLTSINSPCTNSDIEDLRPTTTTTAGPTTTTTTSTTTSTTSTTTVAPTTTTTTIPGSCPTCYSFQIRTTSGASPSDWQYTNCLNGALETVTVSSQVFRTMASRTVPVRIAGTGGVVGPTNVYTFPTGYNCGPFDSCKTETWRIVTTNTTPPGFLQVQYYNPTTCLKETTQLSSNTSTYDISVISGSLTLPGPNSVISSLTLLSTGSSSCCTTSTTTTTTTAAPTTTTTSTTSTTTTTTTTAAPTTTTTTAAPSTLCYEIETVQSAPGECFDCPGYFFSTTDTILHIFDICSGSEIFPPVDLFVESRYSDNSTSSLFIPSGSTGSLIIATSDVQCAPLPSCGEIASPTFLSASVVALTGSISECCLPPS